MYNKNETLFSFSFFFLHNILTLNPGNFIGILLISAPVFAL